MKLVDRCIQYPVSVAVGVILVVLFGAISFSRIPVQLTPDVDTPQITVETLWPGASPNEVEREIVDRQEDQLKNVEGLLRMTSESKDSVGTIVMEFAVGSDMDAARLRVANALDQVNRKPELAEQPVITGVDPTANAIAWITVKRLPGNTQEMDTYRTLCEETVKPALERVPGVARSNIFGGTERELRVTVDPRKLSAMRITPAQVAQALRNENRDISAGDFDEGKRRYVVRTLGQFTSASDAENIVIARQGDQIIRLSDVGDAELDYAKADFNVRHFGGPSIAINCQRASGANVIQVMDGVKRTINELNEGPMKSAGLVLKQVYDETIYIESAIALVRQNIIVGGILAVIVLFLFLRSVSAVGTIAVAIPVSIVGTFLVMSAVGRNINVISLAGMSFAVGMVVDNAIVVLENIVRHRQMGKERAQAASDGANEVWGAVLASTLTTMAVFIPIVFMEEEIGQLYRDIAIAISGAVALSMIVAVSVIPTLSARLGSRRKKRDTSKPKILDRLGAGFANGISGFVYKICGPVWARVAVTLVLTVASLLIARAITPPAEYLPSGNRNLIFCILLPPPGYNLEELASIGNGIEEDIKGHFRYYKGERNETPDAPVIGNFFFVARGRSVFMGAIAENDHEARQLMPLLQAPLGRIPGMIAIVQQASLFGRGIGEGRNIDIEITGPELETLVGTGGRIFGQLFGVLPGSMNRPIPSLDLGNPELHIVPDRIRIAKRGLSTESIGLAIDIMLDGRKVDDFKFEGEEIDLVLSGPETLASRSQDFAQLPIVTIDGDIVPLGDLARVDVTAGPEQINHIERRRAITIRVIPPEAVPIDVAMSDITQKIIDPIRAEGPLGGPTQIRLAGTADDLVVTMDALKWNFLLAVVIAYLLMAALFESFLYPLVIMFSVPLAAVGGLLGLKLVNAGLIMSGTGLTQPMDTLTMLGFIILVGTVINNAILIVHQSLNHIRRDDMNDRDAIQASVRSRIRPIFMSMTTSVLGMLPLVLFPGAGSELYRGIGSVVIGGLVVSTVFTLILVPALFSLVLGMNRHVHGIFHGRNAAILLLLTGLASATPASATETNAASTVSRVPTNGTLVLSLDQCMAMALGGNLEIQMESRLPLIEGENFIIADETFTPRFIGSVDFTDREARTANTQFGADILKEERVESDLRVRKTWQPGTRMDLVWAYNKQSDNSEFRTLNPAHASSVLLEFTQPLLQGFGGRINRLDIERAVRGRTAADKQYEIRLEAALLTTFQRYWDLVNASATVTYREWAADSQRRDYALAEQQADLGASSELQRLDARTARDQALERLARARAAQTRASNALLLEIRPTAEDLQALNIVPSTRFDTDAVALQAPDMAAALALALRQRPELGLYDIQLELSEFDVFEASNKRKAKLDLNGAIGPNGLGASLSDSLGDLSDFQNEFRIGLALSFLFDSESRAARWRQAVLREENADMRVKLARATIISEVRTALAELEASKSAVQAADQGMQTAQRALTLVQTRRRLGAATERDVVGRERDAAEAETTLTIARSQHMLATALYHAATGNFKDWVLGPDGE